MTAFRAIIVQGLSGIAAIATIVSAHDGSILYQLSGDIAQSEKMTSDIAEIMMAIKLREAGIVIAGSRPESVISQDGALLEYGVRISSNMMGQSLGPNSISYSGRATVTVSFWGEKAGEEHRVSDVQEWWALNRVKVTFAQFVRDAHVGECTDASASKQFECLASHLEMENTTSGGNTRKVYLSNTGVEGQTGFPAVCHSQGEDDKGCSANITATITFEDTPEGVMITGIEESGYFNGNKDHLRGDLAADVQNVAAIAGSYYKNSVEPKREFLTYHEQQMRANLWLPRLYHLVYSN